MIFFKKWLENSMQALVPTLPRDEEQRAGEMPNSVDLGLIRDPKTGNFIKLKSRKADNLFVNRIKKQKDR